MLPQTFHKRVLSMCAIYLLNIVFIVHKAIHLQPLSFVGLRLIRWGRQNSSCRPHSRGEENSPRVQICLKSSVSVITHTASS